MDGRSNAVGGGGENKTYNITLAASAVGKCSFPSSAEAGTFVNGTPIGLEIGGPSVSTVSGESVPNGYFVFVMPSEDVVITWEE